MSTSSRKPVDFSAIQIQAPEAPQELKRTPPYYNASVAPPVLEPENEETGTQPEIAPLKDENLKPAKRRIRFGDALPAQQLQYSVQDIPPWYLTIILGFQHYLIMFGATLTNPLVMSTFLCIGEKDNVVKSELIGTIFFVSGICTLLQTCLGVRLPIIQGGTFTFVTPSIAILSLDEWKCPANDINGTSVIAGGAFNFTEDATTGEEIWKPRIREIQGAIMVASIAQVIIGFTGIMGFMLRFIGPLVIAPTIALTGLALFDVASTFASKQWWIALVTIVLIVAFSQYTKNVNIPCCRFKRGVGCVRESFPIFRLFPVILAIIITWIICAILTAVGVFPKDSSGAATNARLEVLDEAAWFRIPYPGQWGTPTVSAASAFGMLAGVIASMVESVGDYYACARMSQVPPPPMHAINRGIGIEGIGCVLAGAFGSGTGTTSYSENIGAIGITKVASLRVIQTGAVIMMILGVFGKFGATFVTIPDPIIGGVFIIMFGMITAVGISNLQFVDLNSSRNLFIIGFSLFFGLTLPQYMSNNRNIIQTGSQPVNQIIAVLLQTSMFVGGLAGFVLDNTIPGTDQERGLIRWRQMLHDSKSQANVSPEAQQEQVQAIYDLPFVTSYLRRYKWLRFVPFLPTFDENLLSITRYRKMKKYKMKSQGGGTAV